jgi:hypothetical protein
MIVNSIVCAGDETHYMEVTESVFLFGNKKPEKVVDAAFRAHINGVEAPVEYDSDSKNLYCYFPAKLSAGDKIELSGESPLHGKVSGMDVVPHPAEIKELKTEWFTGEKDGRSYLRTLVTLADKPGEKNRYRIVIRTYTKVHVDADEWHEAYEYDYTHTHDVFIDREILFSNLGGGVLSGDEDDAHTFRIFSDELFDGKEYTLDVYAQIDRIINPGNGFGDYVPATVVERNVTVEIQTLSENYFKYLRSLELAMAENNFSEPVKIYTNIAGGYGILGVYNTASKTAGLEK